MGVLLGAATLGALGCAVLSPEAPARAVSAHLTSSSAHALALDRADRSVLTESDRDVRADEASDSTSSQAMDAVALAQERVRELNDPARHPASAQASVAPVPAADAGPDDYRAYARTQVGSGQFSCLDLLWHKESGWRSTAHNPASTAYGIAQLLNSTWSATGITKTADGYRQVDAGLVYISRAYGTPCAAWAHEKSTGWY
jgi:hypothetical protein